MKTWLLVLAFAGILAHPLRSQEKTPSPAPTTAPTTPIAPPTTSPTAPVATPVTPAPAAAPAAPPAAPPPGEVDEATAYRLRNVTPSARKTAYDGALMRLRQRAQRYERARNSEEAKWQRGVDNVSFDSMTHRPVGINVFVIQY
jgi:hypothetical protein